MAGKEKGEANSSVERLALKKFAGRARKKLMAGRDLSTDERDALIRWEKTRDKRGKKLSPELWAKLGIDSDESELIEAHELTDEPVFPFPDASDIIQDEEEPATTNQVVPAPPVVKRKKKSSWTDDYEHGGTESRERVCRGVADLFNKQVVLPMIEFHEQHGANPPLGKDEVVPRVENGKEKRPLLYDDQVLGWNDVLPAGLALPNGLAFAIGMGMLALSTWKLSRLVKAGEFSRERADRSHGESSVHYAEEAREASHEDRAHGESPESLASNGGNGSAIISGRAF